MNRALISLTHFMQRQYVVSARMMNSTTTSPVATAIAEKLRAAFSPSHLDVVNESHMHNVPKNSETHFKVVVVSETFESVTNPVQRHRLINNALSEQLQGPVHALSIVAKSPSQWETANHTISSSPACRGGDGSLPKKG